MGFVEVLTIWSNHRLCPKFSGAPRRAPSAHTSMEPLHRDWATSGTATRQGLYSDPLGRVAVVAPTPLSTDGPSTQRCPTAAVGCMVARAPDLARLRDWSAVGRRGSSTDYDRPR